MDARQLSRRMLEARTLALIAILIAYALLLWSWASVFWTSVEPWARRRLGDHWRIRIIWERTPRGRVWGIRGEGRGREAGVAGASLCVWLLGMFLPAVPVGLAVGFEWLDAPLGSLLLLETIPVTFSAWQRAGSRST